VKKPLRRHLIAVLMILAGGLLRLPLEGGLRAELNGQGLLPKPLEIGTREKIDQTSWVVTLGGLRTLVATFTYLRAFTAFTEQRWADVEEAMNTTVDLAPNTPHYWEEGMRHLGYNAASYYLHESGLPRLRARAEWRKYVLKGREFIERGIRNNPADPSLRIQLGHLLVDPFKIDAFAEQGEAFSAAADAYGAAADTGRTLGFVRRAQALALARAPGREGESLKLLREAYLEGGHLTPPMVLAVLFTMEMRADPQRDALELALELFQTPENAYQQLGTFWLRPQQRFPTDGVAAALVALEIRLLMPPEASVLNRGSGKNAGDE
jgi:hypothetical protein